MSPVMTGVVGYAITTEYSKRVATENTKKKARNCSSRKKRKVRERSWEKASKLFALLLLAARHNSASAAPLYLHSAVTFFDWIFYVVSYAPRSHSQGKKKSPAPFIVHTFPP